MTRAIRLTSALVVSGAICAPAERSEIVTIGFTGRVVARVHDPYGVLQGKVMPYDLVTGTYTYDTSIPDLHPSVRLGHYVYKQAPSGISVKVGNLEFTTDASNVSVFVDIANNQFSNWREDSFILYSAGNVPLPNGPDISYITLEIHEQPGDIFSSDALPTMAPVLDYWDQAVFSIAGNANITEQYFTFGGAITSFAIVPEPCSILLTGLGALMLKLGPTRARRRRTIA